jgi:GNAT superfamily N-acetyltransferase
MAVERVMGGDGLGTGGGHPGDGTRCPGRHGMPADYRAAADSAWSRVGSTRDFIAVTGPHLALVADDTVPRLVTSLSTSGPQGASWELALRELGIESSDLAVVARLLVGPALRHHGVGRSLLEAMVDAAGMGLWKRPILDVWTGLDRAIALYARAGWMKLGEVAFTFTSPYGPSAFTTATRCSPSSTRLRYGRAPDRPCSRSPGR